MAQIEHRIVILPSGAALSQVHPAAIQPVLVRTGDTFTFLGISEECQRKLELDGPVQVGQIYCTGADNLTLEVQFLNSQRHPLKHLGTEVRVFEGLVNAAHYGLSSAETLAAN